MAKYDELAIYDARIAITGIVDRLNLGYVQGQRFVPDFERTPQGQLVKSSIDLWADLFEVVEKWAARQDRQAEPTNENGSWDVNWDDVNWALGVDWDVRDWAGESQSE